MGAMEFARAAGVDAGTASRVRDELHELKVIDAKVVRKQGAVEEYEIRLTQLGRELAPHLLAIAQVLESRADRRKSGPRKD